MVRCRARGDRRAGLVHASSLYDVGMAGLSAARQVGLPFVYEMRGLKQLLEDARQPLFSSSPRRAYLDQLERSNGLAADRIASVRREIDAAERLTGVPRRTALARTATSLELAAPRAGDAAKVRLVVKALRDLAK